MELAFELISDLLAQLTSAPSLVLLFLSLLALGRLIKEMAWPPDRFIPLVLCIVAVVGAMLLGNDGAVTRTQPYPKERLAFVGIVLWLIAWLTHKLLLQYIEDWIMKKVKGFLPGSKEKDQ